MKDLKKADNCPMKDAANQIVVCQPDETMRLDGEAVWRVEGDGNLCKNCTGSVL